MSCRISRRVERTNRRYLHEHADQAWHNTLKVLHQVESQEGLKHAELGDQLLYGNFPVGRISRRVETSMRPLLLPGGPPEP
jgi:hypothetical protein